MAFSSGSTMIDFKGSQFERDIILWGVRWLAGIELMHIIRKGQMRCATTLAPAQQFYSRAA